MPTRLATNGPNVDDEGVSAIGRDFHAIIPEAAQQRFGGSFVRLSTLCNRIVVSRWP